MTMRFSPSTLSLLFECERCFWLTHRAGIARPRGMFSSLPGAIDKLIHKETSSFAGTGKPQWLLPDCSSGIIHAGTKKLVLDTSEFVLSGILDDLLKNEDGSFSIVDYKTSSRAPSIETAKRYYQLQLNCYALLCESNGYKPLQAAFLVYFTPADSKYSIRFADIKFLLTTFELPVNSQNAEVVLQKAVEVCNLELPPLPSESCEFCRWRESTFDYSFLSVKK